MGLGANLGGPAKSLRRAAALLPGLSPGIGAVARSSLYHTCPAVPLQPRYPNMVAALSCSPEISPEVLFGALMALEAGLERNRALERRLGPKFMDIDLLLFGHHCRLDTDLIPPHPRLIARAFVLVPLEEIAPEFIRPNGQALAEVREHLSFARSGSIIMQTTPSGSSEDTITCCAC